MEGFFRLEIFDSGILGDYFGVDFWSSDSFLALLEALVIFWGFDICPHHLKSGVPPPPPQLFQGSERKLETLSIENKLTSRKKRGEMLSS